MTTFGMVLLTLITVLGSAILGWLARCWWLCERGSTQSGVDRRLAPGAHGVIGTVAVGTAGVSYADDGDQGDAAARFANTGSAETADSDRALTAATSDRVSVAARGDGSVGSDATDAGSARLFDPTDGADGDTQGTDGSTGTGEATPSKGAATGQTRTDSDADRATGKADAAKRAEGDGDAGSVGAQNDDRTAAGFASAETGTGTDAKDAAKQTELQEAQAEARQLRERLGLATDPEGVAADESAPLDARIAASRDDASVLRAKLAEQSDDSDSSTAAASGDAADSGAADPASGDRDTDSAKQAELDEAQTEARHLRERLGLAADTEGVAADESAPLDARIAASRDDASALRAKLAEQSDDKDSSDTAASGDAADGGTADTASGDTDTDAAKQTELDEAQTEARQLRERLGLATDTDGVAADESAALDTRIAASRDEATALRAQLAEQSVDNDATDTAASGEMATPPQDGPGREAAALASADSDSDTAKQAELNEAQAEAKQLRERLGLAPESKGVAADGNASLDARIAASRDEATALRAQLAKHSDGNGSSNAAASGDAADSGAADTASADSDTDAAKQAELDEARAEAIQLRERLGLAAESDGVAADESALLDARIAASRDEASGLRAKLAEQSDGNGSSDAAASGDAADSGAADTAIADSDTDAAKQAELDEARAEAEQLRERLGLAAESEGVAADENASLDARIAASREEASAIQAQLAAQSAENDATDTAASGETAAASGDAADSGAADTTSTDSDTDAAKQAELDEARAEAEQLRERLGLAAESEGVAADESASLDARIAASREEASALNRQIAERASGDGDAPDNAASDSENTTGSSGTESSAATLAATGGAALAAGGAAASGDRKRKPASDDASPAQTKPDQSATAGPGDFGALDAAETEAERLIASGAAPEAPANRLDAPTAGFDPDDLTKIKGIGKPTQARLNRSGIYYYDQIAEFTASDLAWADTTMKLEGRVVSDRWIPQARMLSGGEATGSDGATVIPDTLSAEEAEAEKLLASGDDIPPPASRLEAPRTDHAPDDLTQIKGIGPKIGGKLNDQGIYYFDQIAGFSGSDLAWADRELDFKGRAVRDRWIPQAQGLMQLSGTASTATSTAQATTKPANLLDKPIEGRVPDDLTQIKGIGPKLQEQLNGHGVYYYTQIAEFTPSDRAWADETLGFPGRVERDEWIPQARELTEAPAESGGRGARLDVLANAGRQLDSLATSDEPGEMSADETEAMRLIDSGEFTADDSNKPASLLSSASDGAKDDLKEIKGVGPKLENLLNDLGIFYFRQVAAFSATDIAWVDSKLKFRGRIVRDRWVDQAKRLS